PAPAADDSTPASCVTTAVTAAAPAAAEVPASVCRPGALASRPAQSGHAVNGTSPGRPGPRDGYCAGGHGSSPDVPDGASAPPYRSVYVDAYESVGGAGTQSGWTGHGTNGSPAGIPGPLNGNHWSGLGNTAATGL